MPRPGARHNVPEDPIRLRGCPGVVGVWVGGEPGAVVGAAKGGVVGGGGEVVGPESPGNPRMTAAPNWLGSIFGARLLS